ncbi:hypothetical protein [Mycolicibacter sinensis]|uniref:Transmembrane protein n=1 Tax=Mycolicibacter sinensis (strain JDM601) TaxID=875328 RepID=A0A1A3U494_MYCSD|nr:hypothetical protein [Mycolicibacter sinensis]OBK89695.1 hypothetical protein A5648_19640 [Mycolicibacter sinensis]
MLRELFQVVLPLLVVAGILPSLDEKPGRAEAFGIVLVILGLLALPFFINDLSASNGMAVLAALRMVACLLGGAYLLLRVHLSRREPNR